MSANDKRLEAIVAEKLGSSGVFPWHMAYEAACLRLTLEKGTPLQKALCAPLIKKFRGTKWARANDPSGRLSDREFLEGFMEAHAPGFDWREDARLGENEDRIRKQENERIAKEHAEDARWRIACVNKFSTPDTPNEILLQSLAWEWRTKRIKNPHARYWWENYKRWRVIRTTAPTLLELKLAMAIPERTIKKIIERTRPKKGEIIKEPFRNKLANRGAVPLRYAPRLVVAVLNEFLNRLPEFPIDDQERKQLRKTALLVKRAFVARWNASRRST